MKKILFLLLPIFLASLLFGGYTLFQAMQAHGKGALQVTANPTSDVYLNGQLLGRTPICKCEGKDMITTGEYTIKVVPENSSGSAIFEQKIPINKGVLTVVDRTFSADQVSHGSVITLTPLPDKAATELFVSSFPINANVSLDGRESGHTPLLLNNVVASDHDLALSEDGYVTKQIKIRIIKGYKLSAIISLPIILSGTTSAQPVATASATISPGAGLYPASTSPKTPHVIILDTPTGFLRVRDSSSLNGLEIAQVTPGQSFPLVDQVSGWFEIQLESGKKGWISSQYAQIQK